MAQQTATSTLNNQLQALVAEAVKLPRTSAQRRRKLNQIVRLVNRSGKLWYENTPDYEDALQRTWFYCLNNLDKYDPARSSFITWLDNTLKWRIKDVYRAKAKKVSTSLSSEIADRLPAPSSIPPMLEETRQWIEQDSSGELRRVHVNNHPEVNCQALMLYRLPPETPWKDIAETFGIPLSTASNFYKRECMPRLRKFAIRQGYID